MEIKRNQAYRTDNYDKFKRLDGNRAVQETRVKKILDSINANGYIYSPIIVNERYEVIDGQGRLEALRRLNLPVDYIMERDLTVKDCVALNLYQTHWTMSDFISSFAELGNTSYKYLQNLMKQYNMFPVDTITAACGYPYRVANIVKAGEFQCGPGAYNTAREVLDWLAELRPHMDRAKGNTMLVSYALMFAWKQPDVDTERLKQKFIKFYRSNLVKPFVDLTGAAKAVGDVYNYKSSQARINLDLRIEEDIRRRASETSKANRARKAG